MYILLLNEKVKAVNNLNANIQERLLQRHIGMKGKVFKNCFCSLREGDALSGIKSLNITKRNS